MTSPDSQMDIGRQIEKDIEELTQSQSLWFLGYVHVLGLVQLFATPKTVPHQTPLSMEFSRQKYWSRLAFPTPKDLPDPEIKPTSHEYPALACGFFITALTGKPQIFYNSILLRQIYSLINFQFLESIIICNFSHYGS